MNKIDYEKYVEVKGSKIHGYGLFAAVDFPKDKIIMKISGEIISGNECERREDEENNVYIFWNGDDSYIDTAKTEKIRFINHNCKYNCEVEEDENGGLILVADKPIIAGEELTIDYGYEDIYEDCSCQVCIPY